MEMKCISIIIRTTYFINIESKISLRKSYSQEHFHLRGLLLFLILFLPWMICAQTPTQVIRGRVVDAETKIGLEGANVIVLNSDPLLGMTTGTDGSFRIRDVPVGRHSVKVTFVGYKTVVIPEILVSSGKETVITIELEEVAVTEKEIEVKASVDKDKPIDRMALVGARSFNTDESRRYAGSVDDPMRAVSNLAGVVSNAGDNSNQIMIRGNSPKGLLWCVEGVDIPNPNHFAYVGTSGEDLRSSAARCFQTPIFILRHFLHNIAMLFQEFLICGSGPGITKSTKMPLNWVFRGLTCHPKAP